MYRYLWRMRISDQFCSHLETPREDALECGIHERIFSFCHHLLTSDTNNERTYAHAGPSSTQSREQSQPASRSRWVTARRAAAIKSICKVKQQLCTKSWISHLPQPGPASTTLTACNESERDAIDYCFADEPQNCHRLPRRSICASKTAIYSNRANLPTQFDISSNKICWRTTNFLSTMGCGSYWKLYYTVEQSFPSFFFQI